MREKPDQPTALGLSALAAMHAADEARGIDPFERIPAETIVAPAPPGPGFRIDPPDWDLDRRERAAREQAEHQRELAAEIAKLEPEQEPARPTLPAPKRKSRPWRSAAA
jgi:hypothetical protein